MTSARPVAPQSFAELDAHLGWLAQNLEFDLEPETAQSIGHTAAARSQAKLALVRDLRHLIAPVVADEQQSVEDDRVDAAYKEAGYSVMEPLEQRLMDGDR